MSGLFYAIAAILLLGWIIGFFVYAASGLIHILLVMALLVLVFRVIKK